LSAARNLGLREAHGEYIGFVDSDDWIEPDMYEVLLNRMQETGADVSVCSFCVEDAGTRKSSYYSRAIYLGKESLRALVDGRLSNYVWNKLYRNTIFQTIVFPCGKNHEDIASMHLILNQAKSVAVLDATKYHYRIRNESITKTYTASNLVAYADAYLLQYRFLLNECSDLFAACREELLLLPARGISRVWRWWYGCDLEDKQRFENLLKEYVEFSRSNFPIFGYKTWPMYLRVSSVFMHSRLPVSFAVLYWINQVFRKFRILDYNN
jgi:glycosyltransferase involved in cell wall biosynthesis